MKKTKNRQKYSKALKRKVAQEYLAGKFSYAVAAEIYGLPTRDVAKEFVRWYRKNHDIDNMSKKSTSPEVPLQSKGSKSNSASFSELEQIQQELEAAKLKIAALEAMIDVAEQELAIDIRKKSGTKQSK